MNLRHSLHSLARMRINLCVYPQLTHVVLQTTAVAFLASRGVFSLVILLLPNYTELKAMLSASTAASDKLAEKIVKEEANQNPHLNIALRAEILYFTTQVSLLAGFLKCIPKLSSAMSTIRVFVSRWPPQSLSAKLSRRCRACLLVSASRHRRERRA